MLPLSKLLWLETPFMSIMLNYIALDQPCTTLPTPPRPPPRSASAETTPASHGVASARPSRFSCFVPKLRFQKMARSAPPEVGRGPQSRREPGFELERSLHADKTLLLRVPPLLRALPLGLQDCAHREPPGTRNTHQSRLQ